MTVSTSPISPSYTSLPRTESDIEARVIELRNSGVVTARSKTILNDRLQDIVKEAKLGQVGAQGEIVFLERKVAHGHLVELLPDDKHLPSKRDRRFTKKPAKKFGRKFPDFRLLNAGTGVREIIEVKTSDQSPRQWHTFMRGHINQANRQVKRSSLQKGKPGAVEIQLYDQAASDFVSLSTEQIERLIKRSFNSTRATSLARVSVYINGRLFVETRRDELGHVYRTEFRGREA